ncbi:S8 family serine peptidase [Micromonospora sp. NPDC050417]|uniref:S8 family serine peptidase n=1 Tax=Micromonospora sp. NPDC050417 TaxID=3364280 RepID=UPI00379F7ECA
MTAKVRVWSSLSGVALLAALTLMSGVEHASGASVPALAPTVTPSAPSTSTSTSTTASVFGEEFVKYYSVAQTDQGRPESLTEIAGRLLGATGRAKEIYHLNTGRQQPDGGTLTDAMLLRAGWYLVLPWDAVGDGVRYGLLPTEPGAASVTSAPPSQAPSQAPPSQAPSQAPPSQAPPAQVPPPAQIPPPSAGAPANPGTPAPPASSGPAVPAKPGNDQPPADAPVDPKPPAAGQTSPAIGGQTPPATGDEPGKDGQPAAPGSCTSSGPPRSDSHWAYDRMATDQAWGRTQGEGVLVAVIDSGVDADAPELNGRVAIGADIPAGTERGNTDCLGSGTAMAGIVAAAPGTAAAADVDSQMSGLAPAATILPLRVVNETLRSKPADAATAIEVAASAGARVVTLGAYVDLADPAVLGALKSALAHDVVVVAPAPTVPTGDASAAPTPKLEGLLLVGGVGPDGQPAANYRPGTVDVIAPGIDVASLGTSGSGARASSGSQYAAAFVAGAVTLVRSAYPNLNAAQAVHRIKATAERAGQDGPDAAVGWGMINPNAAVTMQLVAETQVIRTGGGGTSPMRALTIGLVVVTGLAAVAVLARRSPSRVAGAANATSATAKIRTESGGGAEPAGAAASGVPGAGSSGPAAGPIGAVRTGTGDPASAVTPNATAPGARLVGSDDQPGSAGPPDDGSSSTGSTTPVRR